jgi:flagellar protein FlaG
MRRELQFNVDETSGRVVIKVVDTETKDVIRQIPPEEVLALCEHLSEDKGLLLHTDV